MQTPNKWARQMLVKAGGTCVHKMIYHSVDTLG